MKIYPKRTSEIVENLAIEENFQVRYQNLLLNRTLTTEHSHTNPSQKPKFRSKMGKNWSNCSQI